MAVKYPRRKAESVANLIKIFNFIHDGADILPLSNLCELLVFVVYIINIFSRLLILIIFKGIFRFK